RWIENPVVPEARRGVVRRALLLVLLEDRTANLLLLFRGERLALASELVSFDRRQDASRLFATHDRDARVRPHPQEARVVGAPAHAVVAGAERAADDDSELGYDRVGDGVDHLRAVLGNSTALVLTADHEAGDVLQKDQRHATHVAQLDEVGGLERRLRKEHTVVGDDADQEALQPREAGHDRRSVALLELVEARAVDKASDDLADVVCLPYVGIDD